MPAAFIFLSTWRGHRSREHYQLDAVANGAGTANSLSGRIGSTRSATTGAPTGYL